MRTCSLLAGGAWSLSVFLLLTFPEMAHEAANKPHLAKVLAQTGLLSQQQRWGEGLVAYNLIRAPLAFKKCRVERQETDRTVTRALMSGEWDGEGQDPAPQELLSRALRHAAAVEELSGRHLLLMSIASTQCATGDDRGALGTVELLPADEDRFRSSVLAEVAIVQATQGRLKAALQTLEAIKNSGLRDWVAWQVAVAQEKTGDRQGSQQTVRSIAGPERKTGALVDIAAARKSAGNLAAAREAVVQAGDLVSGIREPYEKAKSWVEVGKAQAGLGERSAAHETFRQARKVGDNLADEIDRAYVYLHVALGQAKAEDMDGAWETVRLFRDETNPFGTRLKDMSLRAIVESLALSGHILNAEQATAQIADRPERAHALALIAEAERQKGESARPKQRLKEALHLLEDDSSISSLLARGAISRTMVLLKDFEGARAVATSIETGTRDGILKDIAAAECQRGDLQAAIRTFQSMKTGQEGRPKDEAARIIAAERTRRRHPETLAWAEQLATPLEKIYALLGIVEGLKSRTK